MRCCENHFVNEDLKSQALGAVSESAWDCTDPPSQGKSWGF